MAHYDYDEVIRRLKQSGGNLRCSDVRDLLRDLGFEVRDGAKGNHKVFSHDHIEGFFGGDYDCGHGKDPQVKRPYVQSIIRVIEKYEFEIRQFLEERGNG